MNYRYSRSRRDMAGASGAKCSMSHLTNLWSPSHTHITFIWAPPVVPSVVNELCQYSTRVCLHWAASLQRHEDCMVFRSM